MIKLLIVDDHPVVREGLTSFFSIFSDFELIGVADSIKNALVIYRENLPDVVLMDLVMPVMDGATGIGLLLSEFPDARVIALTSFGEDRLIAESLKAGARGFLYKSISVSELADSIRQVMQGRIIIDSHASQVLLRMLNGTLAQQQNQPKQQFAIPGNTHQESDEKPNLSEREKTVLGLLALGYTNKQIATHMEIQVSTVKQYMNVLFRKLQVRSRTEAVATAIRLRL